MLEKQIFGIVASLISIAAYIPYVADIFRNKTKPHAFSWLVWGALVAISFFSQVAGGAGPGAWLMGTTAAMCLFIFVLALKKGTRDIATIDYICMSGAIFSLLLWLVTKTPLLSVILVTITDALAFFPTVRKSYHHPFEETLVSYLIHAIKFIFGLLALQTFSIITALYPLYLILANSSFVAFLYIRRRQIK